MKLATVISTIGLLAYASSAPTASPAIGDGTDNVARGDTKNPTFELVDESSHFSGGKRAVPIEHLNDPAVGKAVANDKPVDSDDDYAYVHEMWTRAVEGYGGELVRRLAGGELARRLTQHTGVQQCSKINCPGGHASD